MTNETVYDERHEMPPGSIETVYSTAQVNTDEVESFAVEFTARNETERVPFENDACLDSVVAAVSEEGNLSWWFVIC